MHFFEVAHAIKSLAAFERLRAFFYVVAGAYDGFRFKDYSNYRVTTANGVANVVSGNVFQLFKAESYGSRTYLRRIQKPVSGSVTFYRTRSGTTTVNAAAIDYTTGLVTVTSPLGGDVYTWSGEFDVPCVFGKDEMDTAQQIGPDGGMFMSWTAIPIEEIPL